MRELCGPEYINSIKSFYRVYAGVDETSADAVEDFLKTIISAVNITTRLKNTSRQKCKSFENLYRAMNISSWSNGRGLQKTPVSIYTV